MEIIIFLVSVSLFTGFLFFIYCEQTFSFTILSKLRFALDKGIRKNINLTYSYLFMKSSFVRRHYSKVYVANKTKTDAMGNYMNYLKTGQKQDTLSRGKPSKHLVYIKKNDF